MVMVSSVLPPYSHSSDVQHQRQLFGVVCPADLLGSSCFSCPLVVLGPKLFGGPLVVLGPKLFGVVCPADLLRSSCFSCPLVVLGLRVSHLATFAAIVCSPFGDEDSAMPSGFGTVDVVLSRSHLFIIFIAFWFFCTTIHVKTKPTYKLASLILM
jgi:hypothetical protein